MSWGIFASLGRNILKGIDVAGDVGRLTGIPPLVIADVIKDKIAAIIVDPQNPLTEDDLADVVGAIEVLRRIAETERKPMGSQWGPKRVKVAVVGIVAAAGALFGFPPELASQAAGLISVVVIALIGADSYRELGSGPKG